MTVQIVSPDVWYWGEGDPRVATIVGALSEGHELHLLKLAAEMAVEGFGLTYDESTELWDRSMEQVAQLKGIEYDPDSIPKALVDKLSELDSSERTLLMRELGELAGTRGGAVDLALQAGEEVGSDDPYRAIPALKVLSGVAVRRLARNEDISVFPDMRVNQAVWALKNLSPENLPDTLFETLPPGYKEKLEEKYLAGPTISNN